MSVRARVLLTIGFLAVAAVFARLGVWQVHRLRERRAANAAASSARAAPVVPLEEPSSADPIGRRVRVRGRYDHAHDIVLRGREYNGVPGVEIVSPLLLDRRPTAVLVNRGFVPAPDAVTAYPDSLQEPGEQWVEGIALPITSGGGAPLQRGGWTNWSRLDLTALHDRLPYPIRAFYIRQSPDTALPRFPRRLDPPVLDDGPHLSYAIQWFAFAIMAVVFAGIVVNRKRERGRKT
jgi:surfeit locus 1 family protein